MALSAFDSFCRSAEQGRFPDLADRDSLWRLLVVMTARKATHLRRDEGRQKRGGGAQFATDTPHDPDEESVLGPVRSMLGGRTSPAVSPRLQRGLPRLHPPVPAQFRRPPTPGTVLLFPSWKNVVVARGSVVVRDDGN